MKFDALIQAAGQGLRLGQGPKAFVKLDGKTLLDRAVEIVRYFSDQIIIAVAVNDMECAQKLIIDPKITWIEGGSTRSETTRRLIKSATAPWILMHDVVHPLVRQEAISLLIKKALECQSAALAIPNTAFMYSSAGQLLHAPGDVLVGQKPVAFAREIALKGYALLDQSHSVNDPSFLEILERAGVRTQFVNGDSTNFKITTPADLSIAEALIKMERL